MTSSPTAAAACSTSSTTASACDIMTACEAPSIVTVFFDPARSAINASRLAGMLLSRVPKMNQDGMAFQAATSDTSVMARSAIGRCVRASSFVSVSGRSAAYCSLNLSG